MAQFFALLKVVVSLLPILGELVQAVEVAVPVGSQGAQKLAMVRAMLENSFKQLEAANVQFSAVWTLVEPLIATLVAIYKQTGVFKPSEPPKQ